MLGFSWAEILLTSAVALVVIGPKDIPKVMFELGRVVRRLQYIKFALSSQFDDFLKEHDLHDMRHDVNFEARRFDAEKDADANFSHEYTKAQSIQQEEKEDENKENEKNS